MKFFFKMFVFAAVVLGFATSVSAAVALPTSVPVDDVSTWAGTILVGLTVIWGVRKLIAMTNKS